MIQAKNRKTEFILEVERRQLKFMCWVLKFIVKFNVAKASKF